MLRRSSITALALVCALGHTLGCSSSSDSAPGGGPVDSGTSGDTGTPAADSGTAPVDSGASDSTKPPSDTGGGETPPGATSCGTAPYAHVTTHLYDYQSKKPVADGRLTGSLCPGSTFISDVTGLIDAQIQQSVAFDVKIEGKTYISTRFGEQLLTKDFDIALPMIPTIFTGLLPDWGADRPSILVAIGNAPASADAGTPDATGPCAAFDGVTLAVTGHPEAKVGYFKAGAIPTIDPALTMTDASGLAAISGLPSSLGHIEITGTKTGCTVSFKPYPVTGRYALEDGVLTVATGLLGN